jgi:adenine deaminase
MCNNLTSKVNWFTTGLKDLLFPTPSVKAINKFRTKTITANQLKVDDASWKIHREGDRSGGWRVCTQPPVYWRPNPLPTGEILSDPAADVLKLVVVNRYTEAAPVVGFVRNLGLTNGALASSVAHDSHNIIAVGVDDASLVRAINLLIQKKGGIVAVAKEKEEILELPVAGLMSLEEGVEVARQYQNLNTMAQSMGTGFQAPFMTLSFLSLLVIPSLKLGDRGLFDVTTFSFTSLFD